MSLISPHSYVLSLVSVFKKLQFTGARKQEGLKKQCPPFYNPQCLKCISDSLLRVVEHVLCKYEGTAINVGVYRPGSIQAEGG
jgi:hypothetical protein